MKNFIERDYSILEKMMDGISYKNYREYLINCYNDLINKLEKEKLIDNIEDKSKIIEWYLLKIENDFDEYYKNRFKELLGEIENDFEENYLKQNVNRRLIWKEGIKVI